MPATHLSCRKCGTDQPLDGIGTCPSCFGPLDPIYDYEKLRDHSGILPKAGYNLAWEEGRWIPLNEVELKLSSNVKLPSAICSVNVATTTDFAQRVMTGLGVKDLSVKQFLDKVSVKGDPNLPFIEIIVTDLDAGNTVTIAQAMADELIDTSAKASGGTATANDFLSRSSNEH